MQIEIRLFAKLSGYKNHSLISQDGVMALPEPISVGRLVDSLHIPRKEVTLIFINGIKAKMETVIKDGDRLGLFPPIGGG